MSLPRRKLLRLLAIMTTVAVIAIAILAQASRPGAIASPKPKCANTACVSFCWSDGTVPNHGTKAVRKIPTPIDCGNSNGGCVTQAC